MWLEQRSDKAQVCGSTPHKPILIVVHRRENMVTVDFRVRKGQEDVVTSINADLQQPHYGIAYHVRSNSTQSIFRFHTDTRENAERLLGPYKAHGLISDIHFMEA